MDAVEKAQSGHPGTPMALAPVAYTLWSQFLRIDPDVPDWPTRPFCASSGTPPCFYALIHSPASGEVDAEGRATGLNGGYLDDIKNFRQMASRTPGHPEYR
jgi:transketolase